jgi:hypothetical protein
MPSSGANPFRPSHDNVLQQLELLIDQIQPDDTFIFYFAGHGIRQENDDFLLSVNANPRSLRSLQRTAIPLTEVRDICQEIPARRKLIILDACRNDPQMGRGLGDNLLQADFARNIRFQPTSPSVTAPEVAATLYACSVDQRAYEWPEKQHGVFSYYLLQGLKGEALDNRGQITLNSLADYVQQQVSGWAQQHQGKERPQTPWLEQAGAATMVLVDKASPIASSPSPSLSNTIDPETEMWNLVKESTAISEVEAFLQAFPEGKLSVVAKLKREQLQQVKDKQIVEATEEQQRQRKRIKQLEKQLVEAKTEPASKKLKTVTTSSSKARDRAPTERKTQPVASI